jgi:hypothetical protein
VVGRIQAQRAEGLLGVVGRSQAQRAEGLLGVVGRSQAQRAEGSVICSIYSPAQNGRTKCGAHNTDQLKHRTNGPEKTRTHPQPTENINPDREH